MNKRTKGALAMVLAGSVTFSLINVMLADQSSKRVAEETALAISGDPIKADVTNQADKTVKETANIQHNKEEPAKTAAIQSADTDTATTTAPAAATLIAASIQASKTTTTALPVTTGTKTTAVPTSTGTKPASETATSVPAAAGTNTTTEVAATIPDTTAANTTNAAATSTTTATAANHGQQVSSVQKEKAASRQDKNNGKKL